MRKPKKMPYQENGVTLLDFAIKRPEVKLVVKKKPEEKYRAIGG